MSGERDLKTRLLRFGRAGSSSSGRGSDGVTLVEAAIVLTMTIILIVAFRSQFHKFFTTGATESAIDDALASVRPEPRKLNSLAIRSGGFKVRLKDLPVEIRAFMREHLFQLELVAGERFLPLADRGCWCNFFSKYNATARLYQIDVDRFNNEYSIGFTAGDPSKDGPTVGFTTTCPVSLQPMLDRLMQIYMSKNALPAPQFAFTEFNPPVNEYAKGVVCSRHGLCMSRGLERSDDVMVIPAGGPPVFGGIPLVGQLIYGAVRAKCRGPGAAIDPLKALLESVTGVTVGFSTAAPTATPPVYYPE